jgi:predicted nucleotidyltransferase
VHSFLPNAKVMLFGSRARKDHSEHSDYDLLIIADKTYTTREKLHWMSILNKALVQTIHAPVDVLLNSEEEIKIKKELPGHVVRWATQEGLLL